MSKKETILAAKRLIDIYDEAGGAEETRGQVVARLAGIHTASDAFITALTYVIEHDYPGVIYKPGVFEACLNAYAFGVALAANHQKSKNQESANGS